MTPERAPITSADARRILSRYALGDVIDLAELPVRAHNAPYYRVETTGGRYFLKRYRQFTPHEARGLDLISWLRRRGFPAVEVQLSVSGATHVSHDGAEIAIFEYLDPPGQPAEQLTLTPARAGALGTALARLHTLAAGFAVPETFFGHGEFLRRLRAIPARIWLPRAARDTLDWMLDAFPALGAAPDQPRGVCHVEFGTEHVRFSGDEVFRVIDWDLVGTDHLLHDLGTTLSEAVHAEGIDFPALAAIARGYETHRPLTPWERSHLYEATCFGACKYLIWELEADLRGPHELPYASLSKVDALRALGRPAFDRLLARC